MRKGKFITGFIIVVVLSVVIGFFFLFTGKTRTTRPDFQPLSGFIRDYHQHINAYAVFRSGELIHEEYFNGYTAGDLQLCASVTKSFTSLLTGIAIDQGYLEGVDQPVLPLFAEHPALAGHDSLPEITIHHLLTMSSGIPYDVVSDMGSWIRWEDPLATILKKAAVVQPGTAFRYNDPGCHLLIHAIEVSSGLSIQDFADTFLFKPLGIEHYRWETDSQGRYFGSHGLWLTTQNMAKMGHLILSHGNWNGFQVVSDSWISQMTTNYIRGGIPYNDDYGYLLFNTSIQGMEAFFGAGYGGQFVIVIPEKELVVAFHCNIQTHRDRVVRDLVPDWILPLFN